MKSILHRITRAEIDYGIIYMRVSDGTYSFFERLPKRFTVDMRGIQLFDRQISAMKVWLGKNKMRKFRVNEIIKFSQKGKIVYME